MNKEMKRFVDLMGNQRKAADALGCKPPFVSLLMSRRRDFSAPMLRKIKKVFPGINYDALLEPGVIETSTK